MALAGLTGAIGAVGLKPRAAKSACSVSRIDLNTVGKASRRRCMLLKQ